jgi:hypothetical protein
VKKITEGVRFKPEVPGGISLTSRLEVSAGTVPAAAYGEQVRRYQDWALIPKEPWRKVSNEEVACLINTGRALPDVQIIQIPPRLLERFRGVLGDSATHRSEDGFMHKMGTEEFRGCLEELGRWAELSGEVVKKPLVRTNRPGLLTTTVDDDGIHIGLHVDNWYRYTLEGRDASPNRICVNIGEEARHLLLVNLSMRKMFMMLQEAGTREIRSGMVGTPLGLAFMEIFPDYPVLKLRIEPGEGYLAPTENLVHDASTQGMKAWDLAAHILGRFSLA